MERIERLARFSSDASALTRLTLTPEHKAAAAETASWMRDAGMKAGIDAVGNVVGRYEGRTGATLLLGSHIDTVRDAGKFDGALGVLTAIAAVAELNRAGERPPFAIEVVAFGDEEGVRFPVTLTGSRALAGTFDAAALEAADAEGVTLGAALEAFGGKPHDIPTLARRRSDVLGYVEVHIEQGPVLETEGLPVGIVTVISGASRFVVDITGQAGHAGTVPMRGRRDALAAAAEMILAVERAASAPGAVATVGRIEARPGAPNVIPGEARFTIDVRAPTDSVRTAVVREIERALRDIAERRRAGLDINRTHDQPAVSCAPDLVAQLEAAVRRCGIRPHRLPSGAGHDGQALSALCPVGMLFVRCKGGISHDPAEAITPEDADTGLRVLLDFLRHFRPEAPER